MTGKNRDRKKHRTIDINNEAILGRLDILRKHYKDEDPTPRIKTPECATYTYVIAKMFERNDILGIEVKHLKKEIESLKEQVEFFKR